MAVSGLSEGFWLLVDELSSDYHAALLRTDSGVVAPTQGKMLNYIQRIPLGVVAQITVSQCSSTRNVDCVDFVLQSLSITLC